MILSSTVYSTLIDLLRADKRGLSLSEDEFNRVAIICNERVWAKKYKEFETSIDNIDTLAPFKVINYPIALGGAECSLPANYEDMISRPRVTDAGGTLRRLDLVSELELQERESDYLTKPSETYPVYTLGEVDVSDNIILHVYPITLAANVYIDYLRKPVDPYLDYYVNDTTLERTYLAEGATAVNIPAGYTYWDNTTHTEVTGGAAVFRNSATVDWEWGAAELPIILSIFAQIVGIQLPDAALVQVGNVEEQKNE